MRGDDGLTYAIEIGRYFEQSQGRLETWIFGAAPLGSATLRPFRVPRFHRTLSSWFNTLIESGWAIERVEEPSATDEAVGSCPHVQDTQVAPFFLHVRCRRPR